MTDYTIKGAFAAYNDGFKLGAKAPKQLEPVAGPEGEQAERDPMKDYVVKLSEAAKKLAKSDNPFSKTLDGAIQGGKSGKSEESQDPYDQIIKQLKEQIKRLQEEIEQLEQSDMDEETKQKMVANKRAQLAELQGQLAQAMEQQLKNKSGGLLGQQSGAAAQR